MNIFFSSNKENLSFIIEISKQLNLVNIYYLKQLKNLKDLNIVNKLFLKIKI